MWYNQQYNGWVRLKGGSTSAAHGNWIEKMMINQINGNFWDIPLHRPYIGLIYGRYLQFRILEWPLTRGRFYLTFRQTPVSKASTKWASAANPKTSMTSGEVWKKAVLGQEFGHWKIPDFSSLHWLSMVDSLAIIVNQEWPYISITCSNIP